MIEVGRGFRLSVEERQALCAAEVTLNGERAKVSGAQRAFARVTQIASGLSAEWSWGAVARVVAAGGGFRS